MIKKRLLRLIDRRLITAEELERTIVEALNAGQVPEEVLINRGVPRHEVLLALAAYHDCAFVEYEESVVLSRAVMGRVDMEELKDLLWVPLSVSEEIAEVVAYLPGDVQVVREIKERLHVRDITFRVSLPHDIIRIIEHNQDVNPHFPPAGGRTPLALVRTFFADRRSMMACQRTNLAKGRTGLAFIRTGISFIAIAAVLFRVFGWGYLGIFEIALLFFGIIAAADGLRWYIPARKAGKKLLQCASQSDSSGPTWGSTVLKVSNPGDHPVFSRTGPIPGAEELRDRWSDLSPVMRRRFLASDRTDMAEERTTLACYRTIMARARTGLAFMRTGIAFIGLGIAFVRQFGTGNWVFFGATLIAIGIAMTMEGFYWYIPGRQAGVEGLESVQKVQEKPGIWDFVLPPAHKVEKATYMKAFELPVRPSYAPGIWGTTGLALERTVLADRRNVMARLRTVMARSRTGMAFIRTGMSISSVGFGLLVYFGVTRLFWGIFDGILILGGFLFIADGLYWSVPAEKIKQQFPYCFGEIEINIPDYGKAARIWRKAVFSNDHD